MYLVERSTNQMKCTTNKEETARTIYDVERTEYYAKKGLQNEFTAQPWHLLLRPCLLQRNKSKIIYLKIGLIGLHWVVLTCVPYLY